MLKIHFSRLKKKEKKLCHPIHYTTTCMLNYPHPTINLPALEQVFLFLKKRITETSLALWLFFFKVNRMSLVVYKRANAIMASLLMCMAPAGFYLAEL